MVDFSFGSVFIFFLVNVWVSAHFDCSTESRYEKLQFFSERIKSKKKNDERKKYVAFSLNRTQNVYEPNEKVDACNREKNRFFFFFFLSNFPFFILSFVHFVKQRTNDMFGENEIYLYFFLLHFSVTSIEYKRFVRVAHTISFFSFAKKNNNKNNVQIITKTNIRIHQLRLFLLLFYALNDRKWWEFVVNCAKRFWYHWHLLFLSWAKMQKILSVFW